MEVTEQTTIKVFDDEHNLITEGDLVIYKNGNVNIIAEFAGIEKGLVKFQNLFHPDSYHKVRQSSIEELYLFSETDYGVSKDKEVVNNTVNNTGGTNDEDI